MIERRRRTPRGAHPTVYLLAFTSGVLFLSLAAGQHATALAVTQLGSPVGAPSRVGQACEAMSQLLQPSTLLALSSALVAVVGAIGTAISLALRGPSNPAVRQPAGTTFTTSVAAPGTTTTTTTATKPDVLP